MIKARHHTIIHPLFKWLSRFLLKRNFCSLHINGSFNDNGSSVLVIANHTSWWDGFWVENLNQKIIHRRFHVMMLEDQLKKHWYFQYIGGYSVKRKSRDIINSIDYTVELLKKSDNLVIMFPQGKIHSAYNNSIHFERGIQHIVDKCADDIQVLFVANFTDYFSNAKPNLYTYIETQTTGILKNKNMEEDYNLFYTSVLNQHKTKTS